MPANSVPLLLTSHATRTPETPSPVYSIILMKKDRSPMVCWVVSSKLSEKIQLLKEFLAQLKA